MGLTPHQQAYMRQMELSKEAIYMSHMIGNGSHGIGKTSWEIAPAGPPDAGHQSDPPMPTRGSGRNGYSGTY